MRKDAGSSLAELLVAMTITLIVVAVTLGMLTDAVRGNQHVTQTAGMVDNLRAGMNLMVQDLLQTGASIPTGGISVPNGGLPINRPSPPGQNYSFPVGTTSLPGISPGAGLGPMILGQVSDIVTILYADNTLPLNQTFINDLNPPPPATPCNGSISASGDSMTVDPACTNIGLPGSAIQPGDLIMFSNTQGNTLQTVTQVSGQTVSFAAKDAFNLNQRTDPQGTIRQLQAPPNSGNYPPTTATRVRMITYYLDNVTDPQRPRLVRQVNFNPPQPVAEVLEQFQLSYDFVDGVTNPTNQKTVPAGLSANQTRMVNLLLAARSDIPDSQTRQFIRSNLTTQVSLRSMAFVDRYK
jgi:hypothetical protein